jgi:NAD-reducing hydrogenase large subunit
MQVATKYISGRKVNEGMLNRLEGLIRAFDPCLSFATHANGTMALLVDILNADGSLQQRLSRVP